MERNRDDQGSSGMPENNPSKPMDSKREVEQSNDEKTDQDFPGYPHYPAKEDIMDQRTDSHRVDIDVENLPGNRNISGLNERFLNTQNRNDREDSLTPQRGVGDNNMNSRVASETDDSSEDDMTLLNSRDEEIGTPQNVSNEDLDTDLDVPGSEQDDANESIGEEDEENNYYSLGGDRHEAQEEDPYSEPDRGL